MMTFGSLFAGIGGFDLGFHRSGMDCSWQVEIDAAARSVLSRHWPGVPKYADIWDCGVGNLAPVDVLCGGFPCQDLSVAGRREGLAGERSGLFYEMTRITDELRPAFLVWENVPGLLSSRTGRDFLAVLTELDRIGYVGGWRTLDAQYFGVAQRRRRVFGVFARRDIGAACCAEVLAFTTGMSGHPAPRRESRQSVAASLTRSAGHHGRSSPRGDGSDTLIGYSASGRGWWRCGIGPLLARSHKDAENGVVLCGAQGAAHGGPDDNSAQAGHVIAFDWQAGDDSKFTDEGRGRKWIGRAGDYTGALGSSRRDGVAGAFGVRRLTPRECERLQGFPDDWTAEQSDSIRYRQLGNAVAVPVAEWIGRRIVAYQEHHHGT